MYAEAGAARPPACPSAWPRPSRATHSVAVAKATRWPARQARIAERDRQVRLARAGRPEQHHVLAAGRKSSWPRCSTTCFLTERWKVKSNSSSVLRAGKRAALMRFSPPWVCRARRPRSIGPPRRSARSVHSSSRARSASLGSALAAAGAFRARKRWVSSAAVRRQWRAAMTCRSVTLFARIEPAPEYAIVPRAALPSDYATPDRDQANVRRALERSISRCSRG